MLPPAQIPARCRQKAIKATPVPLVIVALLSVTFTDHVWTAAVPAEIGSLEAIAPALSPWSPSRQHLQHLGKTDTHAAENNKEQEITLISDHQNHELLQTASTTVQIYSSNNKDTTAPPQEASAAATRQQNATTSTALPQPPSSSPLAGTNDVSSPAINASLVAANQSHQMLPKMDLEAITTKKLQAAIVVASVLIIVSGALSAVVVIYCRHQKAARRRAYQAYRYSTLEQKEFEDLVDTCDEDDADTSETPMDMAGPPTLAVKSKNVAVPGSSAAMNGGISKDGSVDMTSAAAAVSMMANGVVKRAGQNKGEWKHLLELDSDEELIH